MSADLGHLHGQKDEEEKGFFRATRVGDVTGQEIAWYLRVNPSSPSKKIATRDERTLLEVILYLELLRFPSLTGYQLKMTLRVEFYIFDPNWKLMRGMLEIRMPLISKSFSKYSAAVEWTSNVAFKVH